MEPAPIILFIYNRPWHTAEMLAALTQNELSEASVLYVFADGPRKGAGADDIQKINDARAVVRTFIPSFKNVVFKESEFNIGVADSIISGITYVVNKHGKAIILEDDIITGKGFLKYMNEALSLYENDERVICIHGFNFPIKTTGLEDTFFLKGADCWGWATWKRGWDIFNPDTDYLLNEIRTRGLTHSFNQEGAYNFTNLLELQQSGEIDAWDIRFHASAFLKNKLTLYPRTSLVTNIGLDGSGIHCHPAEALFPHTDYCPVYPIPVKESRRALRHIKDYHKPSRISRLLHKVKKILYAEKNN